MLGKRRLNQRFPRGLAIHITLTRDRLKADAFGHGLPMLIGQMSINFSNQNPAVLLSDP